MSKKRAEPYGMRMNSAVGEKGVLACLICSEKMDFVREHRKKQLSNVRMKMFKQGALQDWCAIGVNWCILDEKTR